MTSNVNFDIRPILQLSVIALCVVSELFNRRKTKMVLHLSLRVKLYYENFFYENHSCLLLMIGKQCEDNHIHSISSPGRLPKSF